MLFDNSPKMRKTEHALKEILFVKNLAPLIDPVVLLKKSLFMLQPMDRKRDCGYDNYCWRQ